VPLTLDTGRQSPTNQT